MELAGLWVLIVAEAADGTRTTVHEQRHPPGCALCGASLDEGGVVAAVLTADRDRLQFQCQRHPTVGGP